MSKEQSASFAGTLAWFLAGAAAGAAIAILFAPRSGKETREMIGTAGREWLAESGVFFDNTRLLVDDAVDLFERGRRLAQG